MLHVLTAFGGAALPLVAGYGIGRRLTRPLELAESVRFAVGAAVLSVCIFVLLLIHVAYWWAFVGLSSGGAMLLVRSKPALRWPKPSWWIVSVSAAYAALYLVYALTPEVQPDALSYHLSIAVEAMKNGGFPSRISFYAVLPQGMETLFAMAYSIGGEEAAKLVHLAFLALTIPLMASFADFLKVPEWTGWCAGLFYFVTPVAGVSGSSSYNDAAMTFFGLCTIYVLLQWWRIEDHRLLLPLGILSGFCYAIKFSGGFYAPVVLCAIIYKKMSPWRALAAMTAIAGPWVVRAFLLTGNPFAPLFNRLFPNPFFHIDAEQALGRFLRDYGGVSWISLPLEVTLRGDVVQGLLGPLWLFAPFALFAWKRRDGRVVLAAAALACLPWLLNIGTRFLMPALPLLALALFMVVPRGMSAALLIAHAVLSWPQAIPLWARPGAWALDREIPVSAALRMEDAQSFRLRKSYERVLADLVEKNTRPGARVFDMANAPAAFTSRDLVNAWQSALGDRLLRELHAAIPSLQLPAVEWRSSFPPQALRSVRVRYAGGQMPSATLREIVFFDAGRQRVMPNVLWSLRAWPNIWDAMLVLDRNPVSGWSTWEAVKPEMFVEIEMPQPLPLTEIRVTADARVPLEIFGRLTEWQRLPLPHRPFVWPPLNLRRAAIRQLRREGITHILAVEGTDSMGRIGKDIIDGPAEWTLRKVAGVGEVALFALD